MTEATGSQNPSPPASEPWKKVWNDVTTAVAAVGSTVKQAVTSSQGNPWDKEWSSATPPAKPRTVASKPSVEATSSGTWDEINKKYAQGQPERDKAQLHILQAELANEKNPKNRASLQREIARVDGENSRSNEGSGSASDSDSKRKQMEALPIITGKEILASGMDKKSNREAWYKRMEKEWEAGQKGMTRQQKDKYFSNATWLAKIKYPKEYALWERFEVEGIDGFSDHVHSMLDTDNPKYSLVPQMASEGGASGWIYSSKPDRAFLGQSSNTRTMVHETEHLRQHADFDKNGKRASSYQAGKIGSFNAPVSKLLRWTHENKDDASVKEVWNADNAYDNNDEWLANLSGFWKTQIPAGKSWSDTKFYKKLEKSVGKEEAQTMMIDALSTLVGAPHTRDR